MAAGKEIKTKIASVKNTQKITAAMEMVAASKMRRAQDQMFATRPYAQRIAEVVGHVASAHPEYKHPFLIERPVKRVGIVAVSTDRGLCGGLNTNLFKKALNQIGELDDKGVEIEVVTFGTKALGFFKRIGAKIVAEASHIGDSPEMSQVIGPVQVLLKSYQEGNLDEIYLVSNEFVNTMTQDPTIKQLVPVKPSEDTELSHHWDYIYEPGSKEVLDHVLDRYIESLVYQGVVENVACEMAARMIAMKSATDNAGDMIDELQLIYNRQRQASITQEISEIVAGAAAV
ncbi:MAG: F0F1 ATP synthase subunit gamma [Gammaproteobacteria bacterium]|nr:F0F1 ATP synthase subunit gamma [Gammaproteobacteria bacterium]MCP4983163.1 F0F1 ATP synthase subunit gamma [Gammaproteobacteria bacterium]